MALKMEEAKECGLEAEEAKDTNSPTEPSEETGPVDSWISVQ